MHGRKADRKQAAGSATLPRQHASRHWGIYWLVGGHCEAIGHSLGLAGLGQCNSDTRVQDGREMALEWHEWVSGHSFAPQVHSLTFPFGAKAVDSMRISSVVQPKLLSTDSARNENDPSSGRCLAGRCRIPGKGFEESTEHDGLMEIEYGWDG